MLGPIDDWLIGEGTHENLYDRLGAHCIEHEGVRGVHFAVWAPNARRVSLVGDCNQWNGGNHALRKRGDEILGHGRTNSEHQNNFDEAGERKLIEDVSSAILKYEGKRPKGWLSPGVNPSTVTPDLLQEAGYTYLMDWPMDDQPVWMKTRKGHILSLPYPHEVNDIPMIALHHGTAPAFADMVIDNFDEMLEQSKSQSLVYGIAIHAFLIGQPFRLRHFRRALEHIAKHRDKVWIATSGDIAQHFIDHAPIKP